MGWDGKTDEKNKTKPPLAVSSFGVCKAQNLAAKLRALGRGLRLTLVGLEDNKTWGGAMEG